MSEKIRNPDNELLGRETMVRALDQSLEWLEHEVSGGGWIGKNMHTDSGWTRETWHTQLSVLRTLIQAGDDADAARQARQLYHRVQHTHPTVNDIVGGGIRQVMFTYYGPKYYETEDN